ncbi:restriction endonuclease subunit S [Staphylococcus aureus]|uniref:restriction endonuclease subunit S n=1 Tax=Staphylococcus aureus TaxID=1280 RepID=UPI000DE4428F|nr:restriction endonuclease subunit S [Staphylococcus aureus]HDG5457888.1 restriction endonuclease subunit S [Staphylococcus aureus]HDG5466057.1 restriction endonuclease subunit S [Staphylococcus aureus]HEH3440918.1 restriction endonuclease subunit S [Staphylococcus aureus]HEH3468762.1 restriction endonuclease subunit S [Staphylococcus aureus]HEH3482888.1 restriction endonuclease subunit S [Staphylococcus aureus]
MEYRISELCDIRRGASPRPIKNFIVESHEDSFPWVKIADATKDSSRYISITKERVSKEGSLKSVEVVPGDLILSNSATPGLPKIMKTKAFIHDGWLLLRNFKNVRKEFLYYVLIQNREKLLQLSNGSVFNNLKTDIVKNFKVNIPSLKTQDVILRMITMIEDKLDLNKQIIENLEELSQTLFKRWFVDFEFPDENGNPYKSSGGELVDSELGKIPRGWEIITINDFANNNVITGKTPSTKIKENYSETGVPFLTIPDMHKDIFALNTERYISELGIEKLSKKVLPKNSLSISCIATPGLVSIIANDTLTNQQINSFTPNENALYYLYFKLKGMKDYIRDLGSGGSATLNLNKTQFSKIKLIKPINEILYNYDKLASPNFKMILNIQKEIQQLTQFRDTLLPKLMSGEIEIPDDIEVNEDELSI